LTTKVEHLYPRGMSNDNVGERFTTTIKELVDALQDARQSERSFPALLLLYASMDIISSLSRPTDKEDTCRKIFKAWIDTYMLPGSGLPCSSDDIYGARCGMLHTLSPSSKDSRLGTARRLAYVDKVDEVQRMQKVLRSKGDDAIVISLPDYVTAFYTGVLTFLAAMKADNDLNVRVAHHFKAVAAQISLEAAAP
jgi:hypothetical protein